jgi:hypothetical protein
MHSFNNRSYLFTITLCFMLLLAGCNSNTTEPKSDVKLNGIADIEGIITEIREGSSHRKILIKLTKDFQLKKGEKIWLNFDENKIDMDSLHSGQQIKAWVNYPYTVTDSIPPIVDNIAVIKILSNK